MAVDPGAWLSILETACLIVRIAPYRRNSGKRIVAKPKLFMTDTGLTCRLLHIRDVSQLRDHHQWGALVETWCAMEILKARQHYGMTGDLCYWRRSDGHEVDLIIDGGNVVLPIEVKASATPQYHTTPSHHAAPPPRAHPASDYPQARFNGTQSPSASNCPPRDRACPGR